MEYNFVTLRWFVLENYTKKRTILKFTGKRRETAVSPTISLGNGNLFLFAYSGFCVMIKITCTEGGENLETGTDSLGGTLLQKHR